MDEGVHLLDVLLLDELQRVEAAHFTGNLRGKAGRIEARDRTDAAASGGERLPVRLGADAQRGHQAEACDYYPSFVTHGGRAGQAPLTFSPSRATRCTRRLP